MSTAELDNVTPTPPRWQRIIVITVVICFVVAGYVGGAFWAKLLDSHPLVLLALTPINRYLLLTTNSLDWYSYFGVGMLRHLAPDPLFYLIGAWYGRRAIAWVLDTYPVAKRIFGDDGRNLEDPTRRKIIYPLAFLAPNNWVSLLCGASKVPFRQFIVLNVAGTFTRLVLCRWIGALFKDQIRSIAEWVGRYSWPITGVSIALVLAGIALQFARGTGELVTLGRLDVEALEEPSSSE